jgi:hypothetical protein
VGLILVLLGAIALLVASLAATSIERDARAREVRRSNARCLRELKAISIHRPHYIVVRTDAEAHRKHRKAMK